MPSFPPPFVWAVFGCARAVPGQRDPGTRAQCLALGLAEKT